MIIHTTATTEGWTFVDIDIDESYYPTLLAADGTPDYLQVFNTGLAQGLITIIG